MALFPFSSSSWYPCAHKSEKFFRTWIIEDSLRQKEQGKLNDSILTKNLMSPIGSEYKVPINYEERTGMGLFSSLNREQKEALGLLQIGTFLEYFDLLLYIHMAVLLNEVFFPEADPHTTSLMAAFAFCSTYVFRPVGALIFGWLGDNIGRKSTIIITTVIMSISCMVMANLPTYAQIGITATWIVTLCRIAQGMSSMGEIIGAQIYIAESIHRPASYPAVAFVSVAANLGGMVAVGIAALVTSYSINWRAAFWIGAAVALVGAVARTRLRETPDFLEMKRQQLLKTSEHLKFEESNNKKERMNSVTASHKKKPAWKESAGAKTLLSFFLLYCGSPLSFYLGFIYFNTTLKEDFGYSSAEIISHNFFLSVILAISFILFALLTYRVHPIKILKARGISMLLLMIFLPFLMMLIHSPLQLFLMQALIVIAALDGMPAEAVLMYHLPTWRRFTYASFLYALSRALMYVVISFGLVYLGNYLGHFGLWLITLPVTGAYLYGVLHFESLERKMGMFRPNNPYYKTDLLKKGWLKPES